MSQSPLFPSCPVCVEQMKTFPTKGLSRKENFDHYYVEGDGTEMRQCLLQLQLYKQNLLYIKEHGVTQESMQYLWDRWEDLEAIRKQWIESTVELAKDWLQNFDIEYDDKARIHFLQELADPEKALRDGLIWAGPVTSLRESTQEGDQRDWKMLCDLDEIIESQRKLWRSPGHTCRAAQLPIIDEIYRSPQ